MMRKTVANTICRPFWVGDRVVSARQIADAIDEMANTPEKFMASDLAGAVLPSATYWAKQEALNRLFQRWRKLGLITFERGRWALTRGAWDQFQIAAIEARRSSS